MHRQVEGRRDGGDHHRPLDRRRTLVNFGRRHAARVLAAGAAPVDDALASALGEEDREALADVLNLLSSLGRRLRPRAGRPVARGGSRRHRGLRVLGNAGARQLLLFAKPWQRALVGAALVGVGLAIGALVITVVGAVVVITTLFVAAPANAFEEGARWRPRRRQRLRASPLGDPRRGHAPPRAQSHSVRGRS